MSMNAQLTHEPIVLNIFKTVVLMSVKGKFPLPPHNYALLSNHTSFGQEEHEQVCTIEFMSYVVISLCLINTVRKRKQIFITQVHAACESFSIWSYLVVALNGYFHLRRYQPCNYIIFLFWQVPLAYAQSNSKYIFLIKQMCVGKNNSKFLQSYWQVFNAPWKSRDSW